jgi:hypothetical protein
MKRILLMLMAVMALSIPCFAELQVNTEIVGYRVESPYAYLRLEITNPNQHALDYSITLRSGMSQSIQIDDQSIGREASTILHIPVPLMMNWINVSVRDSDGDNTTSPATIRHKVFLHICPIENWASELEMQNFTWIALQDNFPDAINQDILKSSDQDPITKAWHLKYYAEKRLEELKKDPAAAASGSSGVMAGGMYGGVMGGYGMSTTAPRGAGVNENLISQIPPSHAPDNWLCYFPFKAVFISQRTYKQLEPVMKESLHKWVDMGGALTVYEADKAALHPSLLGTIYFQPEHPIQDFIIHTDWRGTVPHVQQFYGTSTSVKDTFPYILSTIGGKTGTLILATLFLILAGPVNYYYFHKKNRIRMLLISVPVISIAFCLMITLYFVATQGFIKRGGSLSFTMLDEATDSSITLAHHVLYCGLYPLGGFTFPSETLFYPLNHPNTQDNFQFNISKSLHLQSGLFSPSFNFLYFTGIPQKTREKLLFDAASNTVINGFESGIKKLVVVHNGRILTAEGLASGQKTSLTVFHEADVSVNNAILRALQPVFTPSENQFIQGSMAFYLNTITRNHVAFYVLVFDEPPATCIDGVGIREGGQCHILLGTFESAEPQL